MLLTARILTNVNTVNSYGYDETARFTEGDGPTVYFQLIDASQDRLEAGFNPPGRRYMPASGATLSLTFGHIDSAKAITRSATQVYPTSDPSIWSVTFLSTDKIRGTMDMRLTLTESSRVTRGVLRQALSVEPQVTAY